MITLICVVFLKNPNSQKQRVECELLEAVMWGKRKDFFKRRKKVEPCLPRAKGTTERLLSNGYSFSFAKEKVL